MTAVDVDVRHVRLPRWARRDDRLCRQCGRLFTGQGPFDRHQIADYDRAGPPYVDCHDPADRKLAWNPDRHAWGGADRERVAAGFAEHAAAGRPARESATFAANTYPTEGAA